MYKLPEFTRNFMDATKTPIFAINSTIYSKLHSIISDFVSFSEMQSRKYSNLWFSMQLQLRE